MERDCEKFEIEIAAAAGGDLSTDVLEHFESCAHCSALRDHTLALAETSAPSLSSEAAVTKARSAMSTPEHYRAPLWVFPLLSASASAAALILYFGLSSPIEVTEALQPVQAMEESSVTEFPSLNDLALPEGFEASHDLLLTQTTTEDES